MAGNTEPLIFPPRNGRIDLQMLAGIVLQAKKSLKEPQRADLTARKDNLVASQYYNST